MSMETILGNLKVSTKLTLICASFSLPIAVLLYSTINTINKDVDFAQYEMYGNQYQRPLQRLLKALPESGSLAEHYAAEGKQSPALAAKQSEVDRAFDEWDRADRQLGTILQFTDEGLGKRQRGHVRFKTVRGEWDELKTRLGSLPPVAIADRHLHLVSDIRTVITHAGDSSNLILDPDLDTYYTMDVTLLALPQTQDRLSTILSYGEDLLKGNVITAKNRVQLAVYAAQLKEADLDRVTSSLATALNEDANFYGISRSFQQNVPPALKDYQTKTEAFLELLTHLSADSSVPATANQYVETGNAAREASFALWTVADDEMDVMLRARNAVFQHRKQTTFLLTLFALMVSLTLAFLVARNITRPLDDFVDILESQAAMDFSRAPRIDRSDELGQMGRSITNMAGSLSRFIVEILSKAKALSAASEELFSISHQLSSNAEETANQANAVSVASEEISRNVQAVAASSETMTASFHDISKNVSQAAQVAGQAVQVASKTHSTMSQLNDSSAEIGTVLKMITAIAEQTSLLALNATIEAARAGEAGRGFAVVANEVKELAKETATATKDIDRKIAAIQGDARSSVAAIGEITTITRRISEIQNELAHAVEEQTVTTNEIGQNMFEVAKGSADIAQNITGVAKAAQDTSGGIANTQQLAGTLAKMAVDLQELVRNQFKVERLHHGAAQAA